MIFTNLEKNPEYRDEFLSLIEKSFGYTKEYKFQIDFYPLVEIANAKSCCFFLKEKRVIATCAFITREIFAKEIHRVAFFGGIAVEEKERARGVGKEIVKKTLGLVSDVAWYGLWSEKEKFFSNFGFEPYGSQFYLPQGIISKNHGKLEIIEKKLHTLTEEEISNWKIQYEKLRVNYCMVRRDESCWSSIQNITSSTYISLVNDKIAVGYAIANKGMDLKNIIHEFYAPSAVELNFLELLNQKFSIWLPCMKFKWPIKFQGHCLLLKKGNPILWESWFNDFSDEQAKGKEIFISGLDSV